MDALTVYAQDHPEITAVGVQIAVWAAISSQIVQGLKALLRQRGRDISPEWARTLCIGISVAMAILTLGPRSYPPLVWVVGIVMAVVGGPLAHMTIKAGREAVSP